jgi:hypothetical protein
MEGGACLQTAECCNDLVCTSGVCQEPPPIATYFPSNLERIYEGVCIDPSQAPVWRFFDWQAVTPPTNSFIEFYAQSVADPDDFVTLPPAPLLVSDPNVVFLGAAIGASPAGWEGSDVSAALNAEGLPSLAYLKITMRFHPNTDDDAAPVLTDWRQNYSCLDAQ